MPVSDGYLTFVLDQLRPVVPDVRARRMFGGIGLYATDLFFGLISRDVLYLKVDDATRLEYETRGMPRFSPFEGELSMNYSQLPEEILEDREELQLWTGRALDVARAAKRTRATGKGAKAATTKKKSTTKKRSTVKKAPSRKRATKKRAAKKSTGRKGTKKKTVAKPR
jgi:DNA transformation protein